MSKSRRMQSTIRLIGLRSELLQRKPGGRIQCDIVYDSTSVHEGDDPNDTVSQVRVQVELQHSVRATHTTAVLPLRRLKSSCR